MPPKNKEKWTQIEALNLEASTDFAAKDFAVKTMEKMHESRSGKDSHRTEKAIAQIDNDIANIVKDNAKSEKISCEVEDLEFARQSYKIEQQSLINMIEHAMDNKVEDSQVEDWIRHFRETEKAIAQIDKDIANIVKDKAKSEKSKSTSEP